jgi:hypothetical protein
VPDHALPSCLLGPLGRVVTAMTELTGPADVRERLALAGAGKLPECDVDALGRDLDLLAAQLAKAGLRGLAIPLACGVTTR